MKIKKLQNNAKLDLIRKKLAALALNMPARSSLYFTASNLISKAASFIFIPIFTRLLTPAEYGEYSLFSSYLSVAIVIVTLEIPGSVIMRAFQKKRGLENLAVITASALPLALTLPCVLILSAVRGGLEFSLANTFLTISLASLSFINLYTSACKFLYRWRAPLLVALIQSVIAPIAAILLINVDSLGRYEHITLKVGTGSIITALTALTLFFVALPRAVKEAKAATLGLSSYLRYAAELYRTLLSLCLPLLPYYFSVMIISQADKLIISSRLGSDALGKYSLAYSAGMAAAAVTGGVMSALCPWIMRKVRAGEIGTVRRAIGTISDMALPAVVIFLSASPEIFSLLAPKSYEIALPVLFIIAQAPVSLALCSCLCSIAVAKEKTLGTLISGVSCATVTVALDFILIGRAPFFIPALITAGGYTALMLLEAAGVKIILRESAINVNKTFQNILFGAFFASVTFVLKDFILPRIAIATCAAGYLLYMLRRSKWLLGEKSGGESKQQLPS